MFFFHLQNDNSCTYTLSNLNFGYDKTTNTDDAKLAKYYRKENTQMQEKLLK